MGDGADPVSETHETSLSRDPLPYAQFVVERLLKKAPGLSGVRRAVTETEHPIDGDAWFWIDDNAKILELLSVPEVASTYSKAAADVATFICDMCDGPLIYRRTAPPRLELSDHGFGKAHIRHAFMVIETDLARGRVEVGMAFHDGRDARNMTLGGHDVRFRYKGKLHEVEIAPLIDRHRVHRRKNSVHFMWTAPIGAHTGLRRSWKSLGRVTYECVIRGNSSFIDVSANLEIDDGIELEDVELGFGLDDVSHGTVSVDYQSLSVVDGEGKSAALERHRADRGGEDVTCRPETCAYWLIHQTTQQTGFALGVHNLPAPDDHPVHVDASFNDRGEITRAASRHIFKGIQSGQIRAAEKKLITSGGLYADAELYAAALKRQVAKDLTSTAPIDFSISYDYGVEIYALARYLTILNAADTLTDRERALEKRVRTVMNNLIDAFERYFVAPGHEDDSGLFSRPMAHYALARIWLLREKRDAEGIKALKGICDLIIGLERVNTGIDGAEQSAFLMGSKANHVPFVDCHAACILALVQAMPVLDMDDWCLAVDRALSAFCVETIIFDDRKVDLVAVDYLENGTIRHRPDTFWHFKAGLTLQMLGALRASEAPYIQAVWEKHRVRMTIMESLLRATLDIASVDTGSGIEVLTSLHAGETNSETQPWVAIGLMGERAWR